MTIVANREQGFVAVSAVIKATDGSLTIPDADPLCEVFRVDPTTGLLAKDLNVGTLGEISLVAVPGSAFMYSGVIDISQALFEDYRLTITYSYAALSSTNVLFKELIISSPDTLTIRNQYAMSGSQMTTFDAPSLLIP